MTFPFNEIDTTVRTNVTHIEFDKSRAVKGVSKKPHKVMAFGIQLSTAAVAELTPKQILSGDQADSYFGVGSQLAEMCRAFKAANGQTELWACGQVEASGGTAGTKTITFSGTSTAAGVIALYIGGRRVPVSIPNNTAAAAVGPLVDTAIKAHRDYARMPFTSGASTTVVTLTKRWKGVMDEDVRVNYLQTDVALPGITIAIATGTSGATNPAISASITAIGSVQYDSFIMPHTDSTNLGLLETELLARWNGMVQKEGFAYCAVVGTYGTANTLGTSRNSPFIRLMAANTSPTPSYIWAAAVAGVNAYHSQIAPSRPRQTLQVPGVMPCDPASQFSENDRNLLLYAGCSTHVDDGAGNVYLETMISTYRLNAAGVLDTSYLYAEKADTLAAMRYDLRSFVALNFPRHLLADDGGRLPQGLPVMTPNTMKGVAAGRYEVWIDEGWVDPSKKQQFVDELVCDIGPSGERLSLQFGPSLMKQFRGLDGQMQFIN
jgi:phage tail sheath gpL-like